MGRFDFSSPGADASAAIATLLAQREAQLRQTQLDAENKQLKESEIAARKNADARAEEASKRAQEEQNVRIGQQIHGAMARGDMLSSDQLDYLDKAHMQNTYDRFGGKKLDSTAISGVADASGPAAPAMTDMQATPVTGGADASVAPYGVARATPMDLQRDADREAKVEAAQAAVQARAQAAQVAAEAKKEAAATAAAAASERAADRNATTMAIAGMGNNIKTQAAADKKAEKDKADAAAKSAATDALQRTVDTIDKLMVTDPKTGAAALAPGADYLVGNKRGIGTIVNGVGLSSRISNAKAALDTLKGRVIVDLIGEMKSQSRTGATGFGQLSDQERRVLEAAAATLDQAQTPDAFLAALKQIRDHSVKLMGQKIDFQEDK